MDVANMHNYNDIKNRNGYPHIIDVANMHNYNDIKNRNGHPI